MLYVLYGIIACLFCGIWSYNQPRDGSWNDDMKIVSKGLTAGLLWPIILIVTVFVLVLRGIHKIL